MMDATTTRWTTTERAVNDRPTDDRLGARDAVSDGRERRRTRHHALTSRQTSRVVIHLSRARRQTSHGDVLPFGALAYESTVPIYYLRKPII